MNPISTISFPERRKRDDEAYCGAFYNLYRVIGDCRNGVPQTDTNSEFEQVEMAIARIRINACYSKPETISIDQMIKEVDKFLSKEFRL